jgi:hypothetical protein
MVMYLKLSELMHTATALTSDVFPAFCNPTRESSISCLKNKLKQKYCCVEYKCTIVTNQHVMLRSQQNVHTGSPTNFTLSEKGSHLSQAELRVNREIKIICHRGMFEN